MPAETNDAEVVQRTHNTSRFFVENRSIAWVVLVAVGLWGVYGYLNMPKRKDPDIPVRVAVAITPWPGVSAKKVEQLVTRTIEDTIAQNSTIHPADPAEYGIKSLSLPGVSIVTVQLGETIRDTKKEFSDINLRLNGITSLPTGAGPIQFLRDFGNTAALLLTVASPKASSVEVALRARAIAQAITDVRVPSDQPGARDDRGRLPRIDQPPAPAARPRPPGPLYRRTELRPRPPPPAGARVCRARYRRGRR